MPKLSSRHRYEVIKRVLREETDGEFHPSKLHDITEAAKPTPRNAYGWLNDKGSFIRNRFRNKKFEIHDDSYKHFNKDKELPDDYFDRENHALNRGWAKVVINHTPDNGTEGVLYRKKSKWTKRHQKAYQKLRKAINGYGEKDRTDKVDIEEAASKESTGWIDNKGRIRPVTPSRLHYDVYMGHLKKANPKASEKIKTNPNWRELNGAALRHAKQSGWLHFHIDRSGYGMIAGKKVAFRKQKASVQKLLQRYKNPEVEKIAEGYKGNSKIPHPK